MSLKPIIALTSALMVTGCVTQSTYDREHQLNQQLQSEVQSDQVQITELKDRLRITIAERTLYSSGHADVTSSGRKVLDKIVPTLQQATDQRIEVEGFTDDVPVGGHLRGKYKTNWELSAARAAGVVEYLQKKGIDPSRMTLAGHGQYAPTGDNSTASGRAENRRTNIDLIPDDNKQN